MDSETLRNELLTSQWYGISPGNISYTGGNVGIGTNNPVYTLDVLGIVRAGSTVSSSIYLTNSEVKWRGDGTAHFSIFNQNSTFQIRNTGANFEPGTAGSNLVTVTTSGNVGIGVTNPGALFQVNAAVINPTIPTVHIGDSANDYGATYGMVHLTRNATPGDTKAHLSMIRNGNTGVNFGFYNNTNTFGIWHNLGNTGATPTISITTGNNVGIGSAGPVRNLDVAKTTAAGTPAIEIRGSGGGPRLQVYGLNADAQAWMGLGTDMAGNAYEHSIYFPSANSGTQGVMTFGSYNGTTYSEKMRILVGGNVGVGTNNPQAPFHVYKSGGGNIVQGEIRVCSDDGQKSRVGMYEESAGSTWGCWMQYNGNGDTMEFGSKRNTVDTSPQMSISSTGTVNVPGVITNPGRPMSLVGRNSGDISVAGMMLFNAVGYNVGSMYNSSTGYWTASVAGYYQFTYSGLSRITSSFPNMRWYKNGGDFGWGACHFNVGNVTAPNHLQLACSVIIYLAVNDFVQFYVASDGFYGTSTIHNTACCIFLG